MIALMLPVFAQAVGDECLPGDSAPREGLACMPAFIGINGNLEPEWAYYSPYVDNAQKGDTVVSAACGMIGNLLRKVDPPQKYSHTGIMVEDRYSVRHSTAVQDRYADYGIGNFAGSDGIRMDVLRFGWPGTITESVDESYLGAFHTDPESGAAYWNSGFNSRAVGIKSNEVGCRDHGDIVPQLVLRPPPETEAYGSEVAVDTDDEAGPKNIRLALHDAADQSLEVDGHYRFFGYTVGVVEELAGAESGWAEGTIGSVCSSFVALVLRSAGFDLEGDLEAEDIDAGAELPDAPIDGQYLYTPSERLAAGSYMYDYFYDIAYDEAGWFGTLSTDAPDDTASQLTNCFIHDWCGEENAPDACADEWADRAQDSDCWEEPGKGNAVSPTDMLFWDGPDQNGPYGYYEEQSFQDGRYERVYRWQRADNFGDVYGTVSVGGAPAADVVVTIEGTDVTTVSDEFGEYRLVGVPAGNVGVHGCLESRGSYEGPVEVLADGEVQVDLLLDGSCKIPQGITAWDREVVVKGSIFLRDDEWGGDDETSTVDVQDFTVIVPPTAADPEGYKGSIFFEECEGGEVRGELTFTARLDVEDRSVDLAMSGELYEGVSCDSDDLEATVGFAVRIPEDAFAEGELWMENGEWNSDDRVEMTFTAQNNQAE